MVRRGVESRLLLLVVALAILAGLFAGLWLGERGRRFPTPPLPGPTTSTTTSSTTTSVAAARPSTTTSRAPATSSTAPRAPQRLGRLTGHLVPTPRPAADARSWLDRTAHMRLTSTDRKGGERQRVVDVFDMRLDDGEARSIMFFVDPPEVRGTAVLAFFHRGTIADQWLYLPELQRVRQITANTRRQPWMGTDFTYADLSLLIALQAGNPVAESAQETDATTLDDTAVSVIELTGLAEDVPYDGLVAWFGRDDGILRRLDCFANDELVKQLTQGAVRLVDGVAVAHHGEMRSLTAGTRTLVDLSEVQIDRGLSDDLFTQRALEAGHP